MIQKNMLNNFIEHPFKDIIEQLGIKQFDLAHSLGIQQSKLSKILNGIEKMPTNVEQEIQALLNQFQFHSNKKFTPIRKRINGNKSPNN